MRPPVVIALRIGYLLVIALLVFLIYPALTRPKARSGPGPRATVRIHLDMINDAKKSLKVSRQLPHNYWPTRAEIAAAYSGKIGYSFDVLFKPSSWGEVYIVNQ